MMLKTVLLFIFCFLVFTSYSQIKFNKNYNSEDYPTARSVFSNDSLYYLVGPKQINNLGYITAWKFDSLGNYLSEKNYGDGQYFYSLEIENTCIRDRSGYIACGSKGHFTSPFNLAIMLYKFDSKFDTLWTKNYLQDTVYVISYAVTKCEDGGYAIAGLSQREAETGTVLENNTKALLLKVDSNGNYLWHKTYGTNIYQDKFYKIVQTPDGGFLCGGATQSYGTHTWDWYLVKTDASGNEEWHRTYGSSSYDDSRIMDILLTADTNYVITGGVGLNSSDYGYYLKVLDNNFNLTKTVSVPTESIEAFYGQVKEIVEGFICIGGDRVNTNNIGITTLTKFDANFNQIWQRRYTVGDTTYTDNYILSVDTCSDGGYIMGGWASTNEGQRLGLIKTDEYGCDGTDWWACSTGVMVNEYVNNPSFSFYPNPAKDFIVIASLVLSEVEGEAKQSQAQTAVIYDLTGKIVKQTSLRGTKQSLQIGDLEKGVYIIRVGKQTKKLIIE